MKQRRQRQQGRPFVRLATVNGESVDSSAGSLQRSRWSKCNLTAASPRGSDVRPVPISLNDVDESPTSLPISGKVKPESIKSRTRERQVTMARSIRETGRKRQRETVVRDSDARQPVVDAKDTSGMRKEIDGTPIPNFDTLGERIRWWRKYRGYSQATLGKMAGIAPSTVSDIERDRQSSSGQILDLALKLRVSARYLAYGEGDPLSDVGNPETRHWPFEGVDIADVQELSAIELHSLSLELKMAIEKIKGFRRTKKRRKVAPPAKASPRRGSSVG